MHLSKLVAASERERRETQRVADRSLVGRGNKLRRSTRVGGAQEVRKEGRQAGRQRDREREKERDRQTDRFHPLSFPFLVRVGIYLSIYLSS